MKSRQYRRYHGSTHHDQQSGTVTHNTAECNHSFCIMFLMNKTHSTTSQLAVNAVKMFPTVNWTRVHVLYKIRRQIPWSRRLDSNQCGKHLFKQPLTLVEAGHKQQTNESSGDSSQQGGTDSVSVSLSQISAYTVRWQTLGQCIVLCACLLLAPSYWAMARPSWPEWQM